MKRSVFIFILLSVFASGLNYITYPALARILPSGQYIDVTVSLSLLTQMSAFLSSIVAITIGLSKSESKETSNKKIQLLQSMLFKLFIVLGLVFIILSPIILPKIHIPLLYALPVFFMMLVSLPIAIISGYLNGNAKLVKLGVLAALSGVLQFVLAISVGIITRNGLWAMFAMGMGQLLTIPTIYYIFRDEKLPNVGKSLWEPAHISKNVYAKKLLVYTIFSSLAIMCVNLMQIADLLIVQTQSSVDIRFYTDIYVISRVVFFAGMILIWPFLAEINVEHHHLNRKPLIKVCAAFCLIGIVAMAGIAVYGSEITHLLFGDQYVLNSVRQIGVLSVLYKVLFLIITSITLYFIVLRSYLAVAFSFCITAAIVGSALLSGTHESLHHILIMLNSIALLFTVIGLALFFSHSTKIQD